MIEFGSIEVVVNYYPDDPNLDPNFIKRLDEYEWDVCECLIFSIRNSSRSRLIYHVDWKIGIKYSLIDFAHNNIILSHSVRNFHSKQEVSNYIFRIINQHSQLYDLQNKYGLVLLWYTTITRKTTKLIDRAELEAYL